MVKRNLLCIRKRVGLSDDQRLLYDPYKNKVQNLVNLATDIGAHPFDPVAEVYDGLGSVPSELRPEYEALLGVTSYYQASKGGKGKLLEKLLAIMKEPCVVGLALRDLPIWLEKPANYRNSKLLEKEKLKKTKWKWLGKDTDNIPINICNRIGDSVIFCEVKNRVDSGGTAARRETWVKKYQLGVMKLIDSQQELYISSTGERYSLAGFLERFGIDTLKMYFGILFNVDGRPATLDGDKHEGFYSDNKTLYTQLLSEIKRNYQIISRDDDKLRFKFKIDDFTIIIGNLYGDEILQEVLGEKRSVKDLLVLKYDDMWLSQLIAIEERKLLLKHKDNYTKILKDLAREDSNFTFKFRSFIESEGDEKLLSDIVEYVLSTCKQRIEKLPKPKQDLTEYLGDIIQVYAASES